MNPKYVIAIGIVVTMLGLLVSGEALNAVAQVRGTFKYAVPQEVIDLCKIVLAAGVAVLTIGARVENRKKKERDDESTED